MTTRYHGRQYWNMKRDSEGHREYKLGSIVEASFTDGPFNVLNTAGLPVPGSIWVIDGDSDPWAWCRLEADVKPLQQKKGEKYKWWLVEHTFSSKPLKRCGEQQIDNPLLEPMKISGSFLKYTEEASTDYRGLPITYSSHERVRGSAVEFDNNRPQVMIEQNVANLELDLLSLLVNSVNDDALWGLPARCVKLSTVSWERKYHGFCYKYYTRKFEFDIRYETFDRYTLDESNMAIRGAWQKDRNSVQYGQYVPARNEYGEDLDPDNPRNFVRYKDWNGENARVLLNGRGRPYDPGVVGTGTSPGTGTGDDTSIGVIPIRKYTARNLLLLNIPTVL